MLQDLPELVLDFLCVHQLSYEDVKGFVDGRQLTKMNLFIRKYPYHHRLFYTDEPIGYPHSYLSNVLSILDAPRFGEQFANVADDHFRLEASQFLA